tara:strand:- start:350 stop:538 length:189 start_codon:yes stop_codon:yes gene_type:complete
MRLVFFVEDKEHSKIAGTTIEKEAKLCNTSEDKIVNEYVEGFCRFAELYKLSGHLERIETSK